MADHTPEQIERWAREANVWVAMTGESRAKETAALARFAAIVAAAEREACAKVCETAAGRSFAAMMTAKTVRARDVYAESECTSRRNANAIRARGAQGEAK